MESLALERIDGAAVELNDISQEIWNNPELGFQEKHAHEILTAFLEKAGFQVQRQYILDTGFKASFGSDEGPQIAIMAEYDALPDIDHACGHNLIAESAVGAALGIKAAMESMDKMRGRVHVLGTPAEESVGGKIPMIKGGALLGIDVAMMVHPSPSNVVCPAVNAMGGARYTFHGKAAHAAMAPWMGNNALDAAVTCYSSISAMRQQFRPDVRVHGVFSNGGSKPNIIPEEAELLYYLRSPSTQQLSDVVKKCESCAKGAAMSADCTVDIKYEGYYAEVINNLRLADMYKKNCEALGVEFPKEEVQGIGGSTDMGNVSYIVPSIHPMYGIYTDAPNHSREFTKAAGAPEAQGPTLIQAKALALTALQLMSPGGDELLKAIKDEFAKVPSNPYVTGEKAF